jgi:hypothetical protein
MNNADWDWHHNDAATRAVLRDEVERVLRKAAMPGMHRASAHGIDECAGDIHSYTACVGGPCQGGRKLCPSPDACERGTDDDALGAARGVIVGIACALGIWAGAAALWLSLR